MKIKVIDLLNKIANDEKMPKNIKYNDKIFEYDSLEKCYITDNFDHTVMNDLSLYLKGYKKATLNDKVEIINDNIDIQGIEKINIDNDGIMRVGTHVWTCRKMDIVFANKINELIRAVKQLEKK